MFWLLHGLRCATLLAGRVVMVIRVVDLGTCFFFRVTFVKVRNMRVSSFESGGGSKNRIIINKEMNERGETNII